MGSIDGIASLSYSDQGEVVDRVGTGQWPKRIVHMVLPEGVHLTVYRWKNYLDLRLSMEYIQGMDGGCGNFNGNPADDTTAAIISCVGARVPEQDLLFTNTAQVAVTNEMEEMLQSCQVYDQAMNTCRQQLPSSTRQVVLSCVFDVCYGAKHHAQETVKTYY